ncbi:MAG: SMI1/KNR4 family protein [Chitinophagaceae bacterium]
MTLTITDIITKIQHNKTEFGITLYDKASSKDITDFEEVIGVKLPDDIKTFYSFCNGFESAEDSFRIIPLDEIIYNSGRDNHVVNKKDFYIAEYMVYCDMWTLSVNPQNSNGYTIYNMVENAVVLTDSFAAFLDVFLNGGVFEGLYDWRERIEANR